MTYIDDKNRTDENGQIALANLFTGKYGHLFDLQPHGIKDKTPDTDGFLRLREGYNPEGMQTNKIRNLPKTFFYQLKTTCKDCRSYPLKPKDLSHFLSTNLPTLLFVVNLSLKAEPKVSWFYFDNSFIASNQLKLPVEKGLSIPLNWLNSENDIMALYHYLHGLGIRNELADCPVEIRDASLHIKDELSKVAALLFLVAPISATNYKEVIAKCLDIPGNVAGYYVDELLNSNLLYKNDRFLFIDKPKARNELGMRIGSIFLAEAFDKLKLQNIYKVFNGTDKQLEITKNLVFTRNPKGFQVISDTFLSITSSLSKRTGKKSATEKLPKIKEVAYAVPDESLALAKKIIEIIRLPLNDTDKELLYTSIDILRSLRHRAPIDSLNLLYKLTIFPQEDVQKKAVETIKNVCGYDLDALKWIGYTSQLKIANRVKKFRKNKIRKYFNAFLETSSALLSWEAETTAMSENNRSMTFTRSPLFISENLRLIRKAMADKLKDAYSYMKETSQKIRIIDTLMTALRTPINGTTEELLDEIQNVSLLEILSFFKNLVINEKSNIVIKQIEENTALIEKWFVGDAKEQIKEIRTLMKDRRKYELFSLLQGREYGFLQGIDDWQEARNERQKQIIQIVKGLTDKKWSELKVSITRAIEEMSDSKDNDFSSLTEFFVLIGKEKPTLGLKLLQEKQKEFNQYNVPIAVGIYQSNKKETLKKLFYTWIKSGKNFETVTQTLKSVKDLDLALLVQIYKKTIRLNLADKSSIYSGIAETVISYYDGRSESRALFTRCLKKLTVCKSSYWVRSSFLSDGKLLAELSLEQIRVVLDNLITSSYITFEIEDILNIIVQKKPTEVTDFFYRRIKKRGHSIRNYARYDIIPRHLNRNLSGWEANSKQIVNNIFEWFGQNDWALCFYGSHLLAATYPNFGETLDKYCVSFAKTHKGKELEPLFELLREYESKPCIYKTVKAIIQVRGWKKYKKSLLVTLTQTGTTSGDFGRANALEKIKTEISSWKKDKRKKVVAFAQELEKYLDEYISAERKFALEDRDLYERM